jgi:hypothetical protein
MGLDASRPARSILADRVRSGARGENIVASGN